MSEAESRRQPAHEDHKPPKLRSGRGLAALALFLALLACGGAGGIAYRMWQQSATDDNAARQRDALQAELASLQQRSAAQAAATQAQLQAAHAPQERIEAQLATLQQAQTQLRETLASIASQPTERAAQPGSWRAAEVEYLMRIANHRLLMERDVAGARDLLGLADEILAQLDDFAYHDVRALLAAELAALAGTESVDVQGVFLRLQALKATVRTLPLRLAEYASHEDVASPVDGAPEATVWAALLERLAGLVRFRHHDGEALRPLLAPRQADYLELQLGLALDRAQLAALGFDQNIYRASLDDARNWLRRYVDTTRPEAGGMVRELDALAALDLAAQLPDISASLAALVEIRHRRAAEQAVE